MSTGIAGFVTERSRLVVAVMLVLTVVVGAGVPLVEQSTSLDQFQSDTVESDALDYAEANFASANGGGPVSQVVVEDENVLAKNALLAVLDYQRAIESNATVNESLGEGDATRSVASAVATTAYVDERVAELDARESELNDTEAALHDALVTLDADENASVRAEFDAVDANTSVDLDDEDYARFADAATTLRNDTATGNATAPDDGNESNREAAYRQGTRGVLDDEYETLQSDYAAVRDGVDPSLAEQRDALAALNESELEAVVERVLDDDGGTADVRTLLPTDYEPGSTEANATLVVAPHETNATSFAAGDAPESLVDAELAMAAIATDRETGDDGVSYLVFGSGIVADETQDSMVDSVLLVGPLALLFVVVVLVVAYRDLLDVVLGVLGVGLVLAWTFGVMGWVGIAFNQPFIIVVVLLIGLSIDYAIHVVMRYREERTASRAGNGREERTASRAGDGRERRGAPDVGTPRQAMTTALGSVGVALVLVTATTVIGFLSNLASPLSIFRQIGVVSAIGIVATLLVFGVLVPALKTEVDTFLESRGVDRRASAIGTADGRVRDLLQGATALARRAPVAVLVVALLVSAGGAYGATQVDTSFSESDFLAEDPAGWMTKLPEPFAPGEYSAKAAMDVLNERFVRQDADATVLVEGDVANPGTLDRLDDATANASTMSAVASYPNGDPAVESPLTVMRSVAATNESFDETFTAADTDGDRVPDRNVTAVYDALYRVAPDDAETVLHRTDDGEYAALKATISVDGAAEGSTVTEQARWFAADVEATGTDGADAEATGTDGADAEATGTDGADAEAASSSDVTATATGQVVINAITADQLLDTVVQGLVVALVAALAFLVIAYRVTDGSATLGAVTILPVAFTVTWVLGSMAVLDVPFNIVTGLITSLTIGLGIDYSIHVSERFVRALDASGDVDRALEESVTGTGGALLSSAATTASGFGVLTVALLPFLQAFGVITALTIVYAFLASVFVLPSVLVLWANRTGQGDAVVDPSLDRTDAPVAGASATTHDGAGEPGDSRSRPRGGFADTGFVEAAAAGGESASHVAMRSLGDSVAAPDGSLDVTVSVDVPDERVFVHERAPGPIELRSVSPTPVQVVDDENATYVLWSARTADGRGDDEAAGETSRTMTYTLAVPADATDDDTLPFDGTIATARGEWEIGGGAQLPVVADVFQRVLERGTATADDVDAAATRFEANALTATEFERLCRVWLAGDTTADGPPEPTGEVPGFADD